MTVRDFDRLIARDLQVVRIYAICIGCMVVLGVVTGVASTFDWSDSEQVQLMVRWGGACIAALGSLLPVRQAWVRVDRIINLKTLRAKWEELIEAPNPTKSDLAHVETILWNLYGKF